MYTPFGSCVGYIKRYIKHKASLTLVPSAAGRHNRHTGCVSGDLPIDKVPVLTSAQHDCEIHDAARAQKARGCQDVKMSRCQDVNTNQSIIVWSREREMCSLI